MRVQITAFAMSMLIVALGCDSGKPGGPGATKSTGATEQRADVSKMKETEQKVIGATENTIMIDVPMLATKVKAGQTETIEIGIDRGKNMTGDVTLAFSGLPNGVTIDPVSPVVRTSESKTSVIVKADATAAAGEYTINVNAHPPTGVDATNFLKLTVESQ